MDSAASAIPDQRTLALVNTYLVRTAATLNQFSVSSEETLYQVQSSLDEADVRLQLLEFQLAALPAATLEPDQGSAGSGVTGTDTHGEVAGLSAARLGTKTTEGAPCCAPGIDCNSNHSDSHASDAEYHEAEGDLAPEARAASQHSSSSTPEDSALQQAASPDMSARQQTTTGY